MAKRLSVFFKKFGLKAKDLSDTYIEESSEEKVEKSAIELFRESSFENPTFAKLTILDKRPRRSFNEDEVLVPVWEGIVACEGPKIELVTESKPGALPKAESLIFRALEFGERKNIQYESNYRLGPPDEVALNPTQYIVDEVLESTPKLCKKHQRVRKQIVMTIYAYVYDEFVAPESRDVHFFDRDLNDIRKRVRDVMNSPLVTHKYKVKGIGNVMEALKWLIKNHPEEAVSFHYETNAGSFNIRPAIDKLSSQNFLATRLEREVYVREMGEMLGVAAGEFNYVAADKALFVRNSPKPKPKWQKALEKCEKFLRELRKNAKTEAEEEFYEEAEEFLDEVEEFAEGVEGFVEEASEDIQEFIEEVKEKLD